MLCSIIEYCTPCPIIWFYCAFLKIAACDFMGGFERYYKESWGGLLACHVFVWRHPLRESFLCVSILIISKRTVSPIILLLLHKFIVGLGSSVGIVTELRAGRSGIESRWGRDFTPIQTGSGANPSSCKMGTGSFPGYSAVGACCWPLTPF